jgi:ribosomal protein L37E
MKPLSCPKCHAVIPEKALSDKVKLPWRIRCQCQIDEPQETYLRAVESWNANITNGVTMRQYPVFKPQPPHTPPPPKPEPPAPEKSYSRTDYGDYVDIPVDITCRACGGMAYINVFYIGDDYETDHKEAEIVCSKCGEITYL